MNEDKVIELYKIARAVMKIFNYYDEDTLQDLVTKAHAYCQNYDETKASWCTFVYLIMYTQMLLILRSNKTKKAAINTAVYSLDTKVDEKKSFIDFLEDKKDFVKEYNKERVLQDILPLVNEELKLYLMGISQLDIAKRLSVSNVTINKRIRKNIQKIKNYCEKNHIYYKI